MNTYNNKSDDDNQAFIQLITIDAKANFLIVIENVPSDVAFVIVQVHSYMYNLSMSDIEKKLNDGSSHFLTGKNIGLFVDTNNGKSTSIFVKNENNFQVEALAAVIAYKQLGE